MKQLKKENKMLKKLLLVSILGLSIGCGSESIKDGVYNGIVEGGKVKITVKGDNLEYIYIMNNRNVTNHCSKVKDKNKNDEDIVYYVAEVGNEKAGYAKVYVALKQTNDSSLIVYPLQTREFIRESNRYFSLIKMGLADMSYLNNITDIYSVDINSPHIFEKVEN